MNKQLPSAGSLAGFIFGQVVVDSLHHPQMKAARSFSDLHDYCDANEYLIAAEDRFGFTADFTFGSPTANLINSALEIVDMLLAEQILDPSGPLTSHFYN